MIFVPTFPVKKAIELLILEKSLVLDFRKSMSSTRSTLTYTKFASQSLSSPQSESRVKGEESTQVKVQTVLWIHCASVNECNMYRYIMQMLSTAICYDKNYVFLKSAIPGFQLSFE